MNTTLHPRKIPDVILLLGTDASGKDHVANILVKMIEEAGGVAEKRQRFFGGRSTRAASSENKGFLDTLQERVFLVLFSRLGFLLPLLLSIITRWDLWRYRRPAGKNLVVVGHNGLRALAFHLGHRFTSAADIRLPGYLASTLQRVRKRTGAHVIVLDVEDHVRRKRIAARLAEGAEDTFDRYMNSDSARGEHIEACLVHLVLDYLDGRLIENNDLSENELKMRMQSGFPGV